MYWPLIAYRDPCDVLLYECRTCGQSFDVVHMSDERIVDDEGDSAMNLLPL